MTPALTLARVALEKMAPAPKMSKCDKSRVSSTVDWSPVVDFMLDQIPHASTASKKEAALIFKSQLDMSLSWMLDRALEAGIIKCPGKRLNDEGSADSLWYFNFFSLSRDRKLNYYQVDVESSITFYRFFAPDGFERQIVSLPKVRARIFEWCDVIAAQYRSKT